MSKIIIKKPCRKILCQFHGLSHALRIHTLEALIRTGFQKIWNEGDNKIIACFQAIFPGLFGTVFFSANFLKKN